MRSITIYFRDGSHKHFSEQGRSGGSYTIQAEYSNGFVKVIDEWGKVEAYPNELILRVEEQPHRSW